MAYIEREKAIAEINKGDLLVGNNAEWAKEILNRIPTADVVEVVRCRNCIHFKTDTDYCKEHNRGYCEWDGTIKARKHYCSYGERKSDGKR